jgi:hypothetical protein
MQNFTINQIIFINFTSTLVHLVRGLRTPDPQKTNADPQHKKFSLLTHGSISPEELVSPVHNVQPNFGHVSSTQKKKSIF